MFGKPTRRGFQYLSFLTIIAILIITVSACGGRKKIRVISPDPGFSYNLVRVPADWPDEKKDWGDVNEKILLEQQVYEKYGKPDFFRILWRRDGSLITEGELTRMMWDAKAKDAKSIMGDKQLEMEWIYLDRNMTISFPPSGVKKGEVDDMVRTVSKYGDPHEVTQSTDINKKPVTIFNYYDAGKLFYFTDKKITREENYKPMPMMMMRH